MADPVVRFRNASVRLGGRVIWSQVEFSLEAGQFVAVLGPNGVGKSTLIKAILGEFPLEEGSASVLGGPPGAASARWTRVTSRCLVQEVSGDRSRLKCGDIGERPRSSKGKFAPKGPVGAGRGPKGGKTPFGRAGSGSRAPDSGVLNGCDERGDGDEPHGAGRGDGAGSRRWRRSSPARQARQGKR